MKPMKRMKRWSPACLALLALLSAPLVVAGERDLKTFDAVWSTVKRTFYDPDLHGVDWNGARQIYRPLVGEADSADEVRSLLLEMLSHLDASHTTIMDGPVYKSAIAELINKRTTTYGCVIEESMHGRYFVRALYEGGPGEVAGLRFGDRLIAIDGVDAGDSPMLVDAGYDPALPGPSLFFLAANSGDRLLLTVQTGPDADTRHEVSIEPVRMNAVDAARNSISIVEQDGLRLGTLHIWFCSRGVTEVLTEALEGPLAECDALVLDIRGRGGYVDVVHSLLDVFRGKRSFLERLRGEKGAPLWTRPLVVLIDERSRSGKEVLAYRVRDLGLGVLVGQRTEGAVLGAVFHPLPDGSYLEIAGIDVPVDGVRLEGVGVEPDHEVDVVVPYARGFDPIFAKGCDVAVEQVRLSRAPDAARRPF